MKKHINSATEQYQDGYTDNWVLDDTPTEGSFNGVTSDGVAKAIAGASGEVPVIGDGDNGKVLKAVVDGSSKSVAWGDDSVDLVSNGGLEKDSSGAIGVKVDNSTVSINASGALQVIGGLPYNLFKCRYAAGTAPSATTATAKWKDTESSDNIWYVACFNEANTLFQNDTGLVEVMDATIQLPLLDTSFMFNGCTALTSVPLFDLASSTTTTSMFQGCSALTSVPLFDLASSTTTTSMFSNCTSLTSVPLFNLASATTTSSMFYGCTALTSVPLFNLASATTTSSMFYGCTGLTSVPLFDLSSVTNTKEMFYGCAGLTSVPLFDLSSVTNTSSMFINCTSLTSVPLFDLSSATNTLAMFKACTSVETGALALYQQVSSQATPPAAHSNMFKDCGSNTDPSAPIHAEMAQIPTSWGGTMA